jgi:twitching motility protein PilT
MQTAKPTQIAPSAQPQTSQPASSAPQQAVKQPVPDRLPTPNLIATMLKGAPNTSDLVFSPGRPPQVKVNGKLVLVNIQGVGILTPADTAQLAADLMGRNTQAAQKLKEEGSCDISYSLAKVARFRVNLFHQRGSCAIVMRVIPSCVPDFATLNLPEYLTEATALRNGIVLVTGPTGSGKSSTLAAILNRINEENAYHIITIEDPIEFLHAHKMSTVHQRELHSDTLSFALALRAALRQAPEVILLGEMRDKETMEVALEAAETGHLVFSTLHTTDASKTVERIIGAFPLGDQNSVRTRLAKAFRFIVSQRLIPRHDGTGRIAVFEILKSTPRTREYVERGENEGKTLLDAMRDGNNEGMQYFDREIEKMIRGGLIDIEVGLSYATNVGNLRLQLVDLLDPQGGTPEVMKRRDATLRSQPKAEKTEVSTYE